MTPLSSFDQLLDAVAASIRAAGILPGGARVEPIEGPIDTWIDGNTARYGAAAPALVAVSRIENAAAGVHELTLQLGVYFIPEPARIGDQARALVRQVQNCLFLIEGNRWGLSGLKKPVRIRAVNRASARLAKDGTALWLIDWEQTVRIRLAEGDLAGRGMPWTVTEGVDAP